MSHWIVSVLLGHQPLGLFEGRDQLLSLNLVNVDFFGKNKIVFGVKNYVLRINKNTCFQQVTKN